MHRANTILVWIIGLVAGCSSSPAATTAPPAGPNEADLPAISADQLGGTCAAGTTPGKRALFSSGTCASGFCLVDATNGLDAYCSADCGKVRCPAAYRCEPIDDGDQGAKKACVADPPVCGDAIVQRGEACDDGNTAGNDECAADCLKKNNPVLVWTFDELTYTEGTTTKAFSGAYNFFGVDQTAKSFDARLLGADCKLPWLTSDSSLVSVNTRICTESGKVHLDLSFPAQANKETTSFIDATVIEYDGNKDTVASIGTVRLKTLSITRVGGNVKQLRGQLEFDRSASASSTSAAWSFHGRGTVDVTLP